MISSSLVMYSPVCSYSSHSQLGPSAVGLFGASSSRQYSYTTKNRAVSGVFQNIDPPPPLHQRLCPPNAPKAGGYTLAGQWWGRGSIFWKTPDIGLASYSIISLRPTPSEYKFIHNIDTTSVAWLTRVRRGSVSRASACPSSKSRLGTAPQRMPSTGRKPGGQKEGTRRLYVCSINVKIK